MDGRRRTEFRCEQCSVEFPNYTNLINHKRSEHPSKRARAMHTCACCDQVFHKQSELSTHVRETGHKKPFVCTRCHTRYATKDGLDSHLLVHTFPRVHTQCEVCQVSFISRRGYIEHVKAFHELSGVACHLCTHTSRTFAQHNRHVRREHPEDAKFHCGYCEKSFVQRYHLLDHINQHGKIRMYACNFCDKKFTRNQNLVFHLVSRHIFDENARSRKCGYCGITAKLKGKEFQKHVRTHKDVLDFRCVACMKCFNSSEDLTAHLRTCILDIVGLLPALPPL